MKFNHACHPTMCTTAIDVRLESASYTVSEGGTIEVCAVVENGQFERNVELFISSQPGSAQEEDYVVIYMERIILQPHNKRSCIRIEIKDDDLVEGVEAFQVTITTSDTAAVITTPSTSTVQIIDNDCKSTISCSTSHFYINFALAS